MWARSMHRIDRIRSEESNVPESWSPKRERQYEHVKESEEQRGRSEKKAEQIAAATVNKTRKKKGETKGS